MASSAPGHSLSVKLTAFFLKCAGFWTTHSNLEKNIILLAGLYSVAAVSTSFFVTCIDLYKNIGNVDKFTYCSLNLFISGFGYYKLLVFSVKRKFFLDVVAHAEKHYWFINYDDYGTSVMDQCMFKCAGIVIFGIFMCHLTVIICWIKPIVAYEGNNVTLRELPFKFYSDLPLWKSPWYEILYIVQIVASYSCCVTYFCFDNFLCQINITIFGQFLILQKDLREICGDRDYCCDTDQKNVRLKFVSCIQKHQELIAFVETIKELYREVILGVVVLLSFLICLEMYQLMTSAGVALQRFHYCVYVCGSITSLYFYTLSCDNLTEASLAIADAAYEARWFLIKSVGFKNLLVKDLSMVIMRSQRACSLTVGGFTPVTLQTFTSICNTAFSFLTLMRQSIQNRDDAEV